MTQKSSFLFIVFVFICLHAVDAQQANRKDDYTKSTPLWIVMMDDTLTNYFEAQKEFESFWKFRKLPIEEEEIIGHTQLKEEDRRSWISKIFATKKLRKEEESERYAFEYKKFKNWERAMHPYVQDDGSILTPAQRIAIWNTERKK